MKHFSDMHKLFYEIVFDKTWREYVKYLFMLFEAKLLLTRDFRKEAFCS